jgi:predicted DNA-binding transcriptional regulator AlpA
MRAARGCKRLLGEAMTTISPPEKPASPDTLLIPADVAGPMCGRSEASWWRDHAVGRVPAPVKLGGRTLWRVQELRAWVAAGCPLRMAWEALLAQGRKTRPSGQAAGADPSEGGASHAS